ncbi:tRNA (adenine(58)-N(1))-methyltransferase non-catalytic subunit TRM6-like [Lytechinus variegatus]|uniref:tRNA (adenine(58)-N(1))-methyltransferase non-catalytic subunit TRM6-like n=1 Tax=Lytechinus variegatus TaxID=7654 RepID=UPI001BB2C621|nr:tRNA (adenine(58)-N(1))-methyltransferase non-catalytic subunit TRM6-like [Lytechinus variegatus]
MDHQNLIAEGDNVILKKDKTLRVYRALKKEKAVLEKRHFSLAPVIGHPYGSTWELQGNNLVQVLEKTTSQDLAQQIDKGGADNRGIFADDSSQKLDKDDIMDLKGQGKSGQEIIDQLIENSSSFNERTVYSKAKYLKKKRNKHILRFVVLRPCTRLMCEMYFNRAPSKVIQIRIDTMAQLLTAANVQSGMKVMVLEHCHGLLVAAVMERLGGKGTVVHFHSEDGPMNSALQAFNFPPESKEMIRPFNLRDVHEKLILKKPVETISADSKDLNTSQKEDEVANKGCDLSEEPVAMETDSNDNPDVVARQTNAAESSATPEKSKDLTASETENNVTEKECDHLKEPVALVTDSSKNGLSDSVTGENDAAIAKPEEGNGVVSVDAEDGITGTSEKVSIATDAADKQDEQTSSVTLLPTDKAQKRTARFMKFLDSDAETRRERKRQKLDQMAKTTELLLEKNMDTLLIATKFHPAPILLALIDHLGLSRPFAVFSPYKEALVECYVKLREMGGVINLSITETWHREYQVLPDRTHPMITMNHAGGYILTGMHVGK